MELKSQIQALIAVGASVSANCQPCLQSTVTMALERGASEREITEAIEVGKRVRRGAASKMDEFALSLNYSALVAENGTDRSCGCS